MPGLTAAPHSGTNPRMHGARNVLMAVALGLCGCRSALHGGLSDEQASEIVVALDRSAMPATKISEASGTRATFRIEVATADATRALRVLHEQRLPRASQAGFGEIYKEQGLVATPHDERSRWAAATAGELARSLERFGDVLQARVHIAPGDTSRPLDGEPIPAKASVLILRRHDAKPIDEGAAKHLIAGAVTNLREDQVTLVQNAAERATQSTPHFVRVGPVTVSAQSATALRALLGGALTLNLVTAVALVWALRRRRREA